MTGKSIIGLLEERRKMALEAWRDELDRHRAEWFSEELRRNLREVADDPEDFAEPERTPYGLAYYVTGGSSNAV